MCCPRLFLSLTAIPAANNTTPNNANANAANANASPATQTLTVVNRPQKIVDMMATRGDQDNAKPVLKIIEPKADSTANSSTVKVKLQLSGDLKGYKPGMDEATHTGNHIHVILDNQPYEAYYNLDQPFELRNLAMVRTRSAFFRRGPGTRVIRMTALFAIAKFTVKNGGADNTKPATTANGQQMSNAKSTANSNTNANASATPEGKDMQPTNAGSEFDVKGPLLTYSRPKGEYKGADTDAVMIDFWLSNAKLTGDGGPYRVRYTIDNGDAKYIEKWEPIWLSGWVAGKHTVRLELVDQNGETVDNGGYNSTLREITITK